MVAPFIIYALPRSRTAWLSKFLSYGGWVCHHEQAVTMRSFEDVITFFDQPGTGTVETAAAQGWWLLHHYMPDLRAAVIHRPVDEVVQAMLNVDLRGVAWYDEGVLRRNMQYGARMLEQISKRDGVLSMNYGDLNDEEACADLFEHCLGLEFDSTWWHRMRAVDVQVDVPEHLRYYFTHRTEIDKFKQLCKSELRSLARQGLLGKAA